MLANQTGNIMMNFEKNFERRLDLLCLLIRRGVESFQLFVVVLNTPLSLGIE